MADWFKLHENWFVEPRLQWAITQDRNVISVWLWCLTECCRIRSDTIGLHREDFEMIGIQQLLNISPGVFVQNIALLEKIKYITTNKDDNSLKVLKWNDFQSNYLVRKNKGDYDKSGDSRIVSDSIGDSRIDKRRVDKKREEEGELDPPEWSDPAPVVEIDNLSKDVNPIDAKNGNHSPPALKMPTPATDFVHQWQDAFREHFGFEFKVNFARDIKAAKEILAPPCDPVEEVIEMVKRAWKHPDKFISGPASTIVGFQSKFNQIQIAVKKPKRRDQCY